MENRIKEQFSLFADRVSSETMRANQMRLYLSTMTYIAAQNRRADPRDRPQGVDLDGLQLSVAEALSAGLGEPALLKPKHLNLNQHLK